MTETVSIPGDAIAFRATRSGGPGGQNVNKVSSKVELRIDLTRIEGLTEGALARLRQAQRNRLDADGLWLLTSDRSRDQRFNLEDAREKAAEAVRASLTPPKPRHSTRPTRASKERRLDSKKRDADRKKARRVPHD
ncbi:MAG TPA: alternative ribosome rescue aminoacyl-tRNA hydrolase ArfB [Holophagaceae bacterium]|nr:alternative ribosome rescue aminoacyl-tRNA hydrolase ArfB [Holophagaceae bacterium]